MILNRYLAVSGLYYGNQIYNNLHRIALVSGIMFYQDLPFYLTYKR